MEPYPQIEEWVISPSVLETTRERVLADGNGIRESGALWLGERTQAAPISAIVFPRGEGVEQQRFQWKVSPAVFGSVTRWAKPLGLTLLAVVHTHLRGIPPCLSRADREYSVQVPGILAIVIGDGGAERDYEKWGWYLYDVGYKRLNNRTLASRLRLDLLQPFRVLQADARRIWEL